MISDTDDLVTRLRSRDSEDMQVRDPRRAADRIAELEAALAAAQATIEAAPHEYEPDTCHDRYGEDCTCWKADTSTSALTKARVEGARDFIAWANRSKIVTIAGKGGARDRFDEWAEGEQ